MTRFYYCHYCDEVVELDDRDIEPVGDAILWQCPDCHAYNDTEAVDDGD